MSKKKAVRVTASRLLAYTYTHVLCTVTAFFFDIFSFRNGVTAIFLPPPSIHIHTCTLYTYTNICMPRFSPSGFFGPFRCLIPTHGLTSKYPICSVCLCVCVYTHIHPHTLPPALKIEKTQTTPLSFLLSKMTPHAKQQVLP